MDNTYKDRIALRKSLLEEHHDMVCAVNKEEDPDPRLRPAVVELYTFLMGTYLPARYPTMFKIHDQPNKLNKEGKEKEKEDDDEGIPQLENLVTGDIYPVMLSKKEPTIKALETLIKTVDEEFLILLPEQSGEEEEEEENEDEEKVPKYILEAYSTCYPSGFNTREKLGKRLATIHKPVPHYREKLERSMDRYFANVKVGQYVKRVNWSITTKANLFAAYTGTHSAEDEELVSIKPGELDLNSVSIYITFFLCCCCYCCCFY